VARPVEEVMNAGLHTVRFDAAGLPGGMYLYRLTAGVFNETKRMLHVK
jgi:hypothetical protein